MSLRSALAVLILSISSMAIAAYPTYAEEEPNDSLLDPQILSEGSVIGSVQEGADIDVYRMVLENDTLLFISLEKTDSGFNDITLSVYDENRERIDDTLLLVNVPGEAQRDTITINDTVTHYFLVEGTGNYTLKTHTIPYEFSQNVTEIELGTTKGSVGTIRWEGIEFKDIDRYIFYTGMNPEFEIIKEDGGPGEITMTVDWGFGDVETVTVSERGDSERISIGTWETYTDTAEITIEGEGNYTLKISEADPLEDLGDALWCFIGFIVVSLVAFFGLLVLVIVVVYRATRKKEGPEGQARDLPPSMRPPRTARTPPPPSDRSEKW
jgi:hypothetical protein